MNATLIWIAVLSGVSAAQEGVAPIAPNWGVRAGSYQLAISTEKQVYLSGEAIKVTAIVKNVSDKPAWFRRIGPYTFYEMDIRIPYPAWIPLSPRAVLTPVGQELKFPRGSSAKGFVTRPGQEIVDAIDIERLYYMAAPGDYRVVFSARVASEREEDPSVTATSNELKITVLDKPK